MSLEKLKITPLKKNMTSKTASPDLDESNEFVCQFNPETFSVTKSNEWNQRLDMGSETGEMIFSGGRSGSISFTFMFDTTNSGKDVRDKYLPLVKMRMVKPSDNPDNKGQPPQVMVRWGDYLSYICVIKSLSEKFLFFKSSGRPLRAEVTVGLTQIWDMSKKAGTNPTSRTEARRTWIVERGQRLDWIAHQVYGDSSVWRHIAETNNIESPTVLRPGQILKLVPIK